MILGFKGFKPGLVATLGNGKFQYVPNELNETKKAMCASTGFHYCLDPWDCLNWYTWNGKNEFWAVAAGGDVDEDGYGSRSSCTKLVPLRKLTAEEFLLITSITAPRTVEDGSSTRLTIKLKQASINSTDMANISVKYIRGGTSKKNTGAGQKSSSSTSGTQKDEKATKSSILCSGAKAIGLFK